MQDIEIPRAGKGKRRVFARRFFFLGTKVRSPASQKVPGSRGGGGTNTATGHCLPPSPPFLYRSASHGTPNSPRISVCSPSWKRFLFSLAAVDMTLTQHGPWIMFALSRWPRPPGLASYTCGVDIWLLTRYLDK